MMLISPTMGVLETSFSDCHFSKTITAPIKQLKTVFYTTNASSLAQITRAVTRRSLTNQIQLANLGILQL